MLFFIGVYQIKSYFYHKKCTIQDPYSFLKKNSCNNNILTRGKSIQIHRSFS